MNNENNNLNKDQSVNTTPVVPSTAPVANKFMPISDISQINQSAPTVPVTEPVVSPQPQMDNTTMVNENLQKVEIKDYTPPSKFKIFLLFLFFALLIAFVIFLPQISTIVREYMNGSNNYQKEEEIITTGKLICSLEANTSELDKEYEFDFSFTDSKLKTTKYIAYTRGDSTTEALLDEVAEKCKTLKTEVKDFDGVTIKCDYSDGKLTETQVFELETVDTEKLSAAFTEAGGMLPSYSFDQDIDEIEKTMKASNYTCERQK